MRSQFGRRRLFRLVAPKYPSFNVYSHIARKTTALGPICVATAVSKLPGWDVEIIDENNYRFPGPLDAQRNPDHSALQELRPADVVGFYGGLSCTIPRLHELAAQYRSWGVATVGGGAHLDALPEESLQAGLDVVVHGEGEETIGEILAAWDAERGLEEVAGVSFLNPEGELIRTAARPPLEEFEDMPLPDFGLLRYARMQVFPISRTRGCGANCEFCMVKGRARCASPQRLLAQISLLAEGFGARMFFVVDDHFVQNRRETLEFCRILKDYQQKTQLSFFITVQVRLEVARDAELIAAMRECGIRCLAIGFESVIDEELRAMRKGLRAADMLDLVERFRRAGFLIHGMFIFGYPAKGKGFAMSARERAKRFNRFIRKARLDTIQVLLPVPLPATAFRERMAAQGRLLPMSWKYYDGNFPLVTPDAPITPREAQQTILRIMRSFYRFRSMFWVGFHTLYFPVAMFPLVNLRERWFRWYRLWRNDVIRFVGWCIIRNWRKKVRNDSLEREMRKVFDSSNTINHA